MHGFSLFFWIISLQCVGYLIGELTNSRLNLWYDSLQRSPLTPPGIAFAIVWPILYIMIAISGWMIFTKLPKGSFYSAKFFFTLQLLLNWLWTPLFFHLHLTGFSALCILLILISTVVVIRQIFKRLPWAAILLIPYGLWLIFAFYLNLYIYIYNS